VAKKLSKEHLAAMAAGRKRAARRRRLALVMAEPTKVEQKKAPVKPTAPPKNLAVARKTGVSSPLVTITCTEGTLEIQLVGKGGEVRFSSKVNKPINVIVLSQLLKNMVV